jgi:hypothetical protein
MTKFRVELVQTVVETAVVWINASNEAEAEDVALAQAKTGADIDWKFKDVLGDIEPLSVQQQTTTETAR